MQIQVFRTDRSSYQSDDFIKMEKELFNGVHEKLHYTSNIEDLNPENSFILITNTHTDIDELPQAILDNTLLMIHPNSGYDNIHKNFINIAKFPIITGNIIRCQAVCEYVLSCLFHHFTPIKNFTHWPSTRDWDRKLLRDQKILIYGYGHIGKALEEALKGISTEVYFLDPTLKLNPLKKYYSSLENVEVSSFDIHIIAASLTDSSENLFNETHLQACKKDSLIINPARGEIINTKDLEKLSTLKNFSLFLDVFEKEPYPPAYLSEIKNLNRTPHIAGVYDDLCKDILEFELFITKTFLSYLMKDSLDDFKKEFHHSILNTKSSISQ
jgi:D-3-phosphoglycerate dehydrogenase